MKKQPTRCGWVNTDPLYVTYHDEEWGVPVYDDRILFEMLNLEGAQAGLSWYTVLKKRAHYQKVFDQFDPLKIIHYNDKKIAALLADPGIIRNRLKVAAVVENAKAFLRLKDEGINFSDYIWQFVDGKPIQNQPATLKQVPASTPLSDQMSKDLKKKGFKFIGSTICYAYMQAVGMVNDHVKDCFRCQQVKRHK
ncbi:MAG: DNA-3-methyladenine glycosylase I [Gammaproteobacteria bacterium]